MNPYVNGGVESSLTSCLYFCDLITLGYLINRGWNKWGGWKNFQNLEKVGNFWKGRYYRRINAKKEIFKNIFPKIKQVEGVGIRMSCEENFQWGCLLGIREYDLFYGSWPGDTLSLIWPPSIRFDWNVTIIVKHFILFILSLMSKTLMGEFNMKGIEKRHQKKKVKFQDTLTYSVVMGKRNLNFAALYAK